MILSFRKLLDFAILIALGLGAVICFLGLFGSIIPFFDLINHFQVLIFVGSAFALVASVVWPHTSDVTRRIGQIFISAMLFSSLLLLGTEFVKRGVFFPATQAHASLSGKSSSIKLMSFNIYMGTWDRKGLASSVLRHNPDLVALQEYAPNRFKNQNDLKRAYPYQARCKNWRICTLAILSKYKLTALKSYQLGSRSRKDRFHGKALAATVHLPDGVEARLYSVHLAWPLPVDEKLLQLQRLSEIIKEESERYPNQIAAGDFNASGWAFRIDEFSNKSNLVRRSLLLPTFPSPNSRMWGMKLPALLSLDHILTSPDIRSGPVVRASASVGDHWPIMANLFIPRNK